MPIIIQKCKLFLVILSVSLIGNFLHGMDATTTSLPSAAAAATAAQTSIDQEMKELANVLMNFNMSIITKGSHSPSNKTTSSPNNDWKKNLAFMNQSCANRSMAVTEFLFDEYTRLEKVRVWVQYPAITNHLIENGTRDPFIHTIGFFQRHPHLTKGILVSSITVMSILSYKALQWYGLKK